MFAVTCRNFSSKLYRTQSIVALLLKFLYTQPFKYHKLEPCIDETVTATKEELTIMYREMQIIRKMEERARELYMSKSIRGFCHLYIGQVCTYLLINK